MCAQVLSVNAQIVAMDKNKPFVNYGLPACITPVEEILQASEKIIYATPTLKNVKIISYNYSLVLA
ncbi:hypothetical protein A3860_32050 [Niastella vici]|uniref:Uncharacterized protein n=2 Tax=Niastella vici TaxID=1703345 RepID=A0A1V9FTI3_9BACT|nr:hypothetical protein A3860_32050 [Niastella vici]